MDSYNQTNIKSLNIPSKQGGFLFHYQSFRYWVCKLKNRENKLQVESRSLIYSDYTEAQRIL